MQIAKEIAGFSGAKADDLRKAIGKKNREAMASSSRSSSRVAGVRAPAEAVIEELWTTNETQRRLLVQQVPLGLLRADRIPDRMAEGQLSGGVHGRADLLGDGHQGQGPVLRRPGRTDGDRHPAARRQPVRPSVCRRRQADPLWPGCGQGRRHAAVEAIKEARDRIQPTTPNTIQPDTRRPFTDIYDFCERIDSRAVNRKAIEALIKCGAFSSTGDSRRGMLVVLEQAQQAGQKAQQDAADRAAVDLRPRLRRRPRPRGWTARATRRSRPVSLNRPNCWHSRRNRSASSFPPTR